MSEQSWCLKSHAQLQPVWEEGHLCPDLPVPGPVFARYIEEVAGGLAERNVGCLGSSSAPLGFLQPVRGGGRSEL